MIDLRDTTFLIPIRCESRDRAWNIQYTLQYLCRHFDTNILIWESDKKPIASEILRQVRTFNAKITYFFNKCDNSIFHRTRLLNEMLAEVKTLCCVNYDADVILEIQSYVKARDEILNGTDLVYPYFFGKSQRKVYRPNMMSDLIQEIKHEEAQAEYGQVQFFKTDSYREGGMENEDFISWAPEDKERCIRFQKLGYRVKWLDGLIYHIEHSRGINSGKTNPHYEANEKKYAQLDSLNPNELRSYYNTASYLKKYKMPKITLLTYSNLNYMKQQLRLIERAHELQAVDDSFQYNRERLETTIFYKENKELLDHPKGAGWWVWKPYLILMAMEEMQENDILVYLDSGDFISSSFREFIIRKMRNHNILLTEGSYPCSAYTKRDVFATMGCDEERYWDALQIEAGIIVCKKNDATIHIIKEWLKWCLTPGLVTDEQSQTKNLPDFIEHRHDQSILSIMRVFHGIECTNEMRQFINCNHHQPAK